VISRRVPMLIRPAIDDTDPIRYRRPTPDGQFSGNIIDEAMRARSASKSDHSPRIATHCIDELIGCPTKVTVGSRLGVISQADSQD
jgi:hypothetical protein